MATRRSSSRVTHMYKLDSKPYADMMKKAGEAADGVLKRYGQPTVSLAELRTRLDRELRDISLTELILKEREAGW